MLPSSYIRHKSTFHSTQYPFIVDTDMQFNKTHRTHCCFSTATMVTRKNHSFVVYEHCLCECHILVIHKKQKGCTDCQTKLHLTSKSVIWVTKAEIRSKQKTDIKCSCNWLSPLSFCSFIYTSFAFFSFCRYIICYTSSVLYVKCFVSSILSFKSLIYTPVLRVYLIPPR